MVTALKKSPKKASRKDAKSAKKNLGFIAGLV
jgi:hypothetical protein